MPAAVLAPLTLVQGDEELLVDRAVSAIVRAARAKDPDTELHDLLAEELSGGEFVEALSPSLFGEQRVLIVRGVQDLEQPLADELLGCLNEPVDGACVVVVHAGGVKAKKLLEKLAKIATVTVAAPRVKKFGERRDFLRRELRADGRHVDDEAIAGLLDAVGNDLRGLAVAAEQLLADTEGPITADVVATYYRGRAESSGFAIADRAVDGDLGGALELVRWGQSTGLAPVLVTSALAGTLRSMAQVASAGRTPAHELASALGMPSWKVEKTQRQVRRWRPEGLSQALAAVALADAAVKGASVDTNYAVERALLAVCEARQAGR